MSAAPSKGRAIFPKGPIALGRIADAELRSVRQGPDGMIARYRLSAREEPEFVERMEAIRGVTGFRYAPIPGMWASFVSSGSVQEGEEEEDQPMDLVLGADLSFVQSQLASMGTLKIDRDVVVPPFVVRTLALGYLHRVGS